MVPSDSSKLHRKHCVYLGEASHPLWGLWRAEPGLADEHIAVPRGQAASLLNLLRVKSAPITRPAEPGGVEDMPEPLTRSTTVSPMLDVGEVQEVADAGE